MLWGEQEQGGVPGKEAGGCGGCTLSLSSGDVRGPGGQVHLEMPVSALLPACAPCSILLGSEPSREATRGLIQGEGSEGREQIKEWACQIMAGKHQREVAAELVASVDSELAVQLAWSKKCCRWEWAWGAAWEPTATAGWGRAGRGWRGSHLISSVSGPRLCVCVCVQVPVALGLCMGSGIILDTSTSGVSLSQWGCEAPSVCPYIRERREQGQGGAVRGGGWQAGRTWEGTRAPWTPSFHAVCCQHCAKYRGQCASPVAHLSAISRGARGPETQDIPVVQWRTWGCEVLSSSPVTQPKRRHLLAAMKWGNGTLYS